MLFSKFTNQTDNVVAVNFISGILGGVNALVFWVLLIPLNFVHQCPNNEDSQLALCSFSEEMGLPPTSKSWGLLNANVACGERLVCETNLGSA